MPADIIYKHFPELSELQRSQIDALGDLYTSWNEKINVISRKDIDNLYTNHVLHSLSIARFLGPLQSGTSFLDVGTGGGFPGIPLAIYYPECTFHLIDRIGKKIRVATEVALAVGLDNVSFQHGDVAECRRRFTYVVSRAVMPLNQLVKLITKNVERPDKKHPGANKYAPGLVCLKGGDITEESKGIRTPVLNFPVNEFVDEPHFTDKSIIYLPL